MPKTRYGVSAWVHQFPSSRRPDYPRLRGDLPATVVIVGGGLTGCAIAYACAQAGMKPVLVERDRIGAASSGSGAGLLLPDPGPDFRHVAAAHGLRAARRVFEAWRGGARDGAALLRRLGVKCALEPLDVLVTTERDGEKLLRREFEARVNAGLDVSWRTARQVKSGSNLDVSAALKLRDAFSFDPYRACVGLAAAAVKRGARIFEKSSVRTIKTGRRDVEIVLETGSIRAGTVIVATGTPGPELKSLRRHFAAREVYFVLTEPLPAAMRRQLGDPSVAIRDTRTPPRRLRWTPDSWLVVGGGDQDQPPARQHDAVLVQRTGDLMYGLLTMYPAISGLHPEYGWSASYGETADGLMVIGSHRNYPRHLFALGGSPHSATGAFLAARVLLRALQGRPDKGDEFFNFAR